MTAILSKRRKMSNDRTLGKYLKYAIGETLLIVVGILIALQINNWNEDRKNLETINSIYSIVKSDLELDLWTIDWVLENKTPQGEIALRAINGEITREEYSQCDECRGILGGFPDFTLKTRGLELLQDHSAMFHASEDSLFHSIHAFYNYHHTEIAVALGEVSADFQDNYFHFKHHMDWFGDHLENKMNEDFVTYALTSNDYRNRVQSHHLLYYGIYLEHLKMYKEGALKLIEVIDERMEVSG